MNEWVEEYFNAPNQWDLDKILNTGYEEELQKLLHEMLMTVLEENPPIVLPRLDAEKKLWFYVIGKDTQQLNELRGVISAYLGGTYVSLDKNEHRSSNDPSEKAILNQFPVGFLRLHIHKSINKDKKRVYWVIGTLNKLIRQFHERPLLLSTIRRPTGRILRDFFIAFNHQDYESAVLYYEELKERQLLSKRNLISLELQSLSSGCRWNNLLNHPSLPDILTGRIPRRIYLLILRALLNVSLNPEKLENYEINEIRKKYAHLDQMFFRKPDIPISHEFVYEWKCWSIGACAYGFSRVLEDLPECINEDWKAQLTKWASLSTSLSQKNPSSHSLELLIQAVPSVEVAALLLKESVTSSDEQVMHIHHRINEYPDTLKKDVLGNKLLRKLWDVIDEIHGDYIDVSSWSALFTCIAESSCRTDPVQCAIERSEYWDAKSWNEQVLVELVSGASNNDSTLRDVLPILLPWLDNNKLTLTVDCIEQLLLNLATDTYISMQDLVLCADLTGLLIEIPHTKTQYSTAIEAIQACWNKVKSNASVDAGLDIIDILIDAPCADTDGREQLWYLIQEFLLLDWQRLEKRQKLLAMQYSDELTGTSQQFAEYYVQDTDVVDIGAPSLDGKKLCVYTLTEGAA